MCISTYYVNIYSNSMCIDIHTHTRERIFIQAAVWHCAMGEEDLTRSLTEIPSEQQAACFTPLPLFLRPHCLLHFRGRPSELRQIGLRRTRLCCGDPIRLSEKIAQDCRGLKVRVSNIEPADFASRGVLRALRQLRSCFDSLI